VTAGAGQEDPLGHWPDRTPVYDERGDVLVVFSPAEHLYAGRRWADGMWRPPAVPVGEAVETITAALPEWAVSTSDSELVAGLLAAGAETVRHAHSMTHDLSDVPSPPPVEVHLTSVGAAGLRDLRDPVGLLLHLAYPPGHPDHRHPDAEHAAAAVAGIADGESLAPLLDTTTIAWVGETVVGACLVVDRDGDPPDGGPWVLDVFRDPSSPIRGVGKAMLVHALNASAAASHPALSLVVSHENTVARRLYMGLGFTPVSESWTIGIAGD
jgi:hypothetical protein